ncbi:hypothetical protein ROG8370_02677 [Roseovarius gaetbuli]|uniref:Uncharacterized protein n=1 Tax=Roseovarius gaetbuli TaxID=1356575 RepID=A0A1X6ZQP3_9RHOB|nr:hypothetical protein ROG8370_02677 [Roseovarius gaetbuli]
MARPSLPKAQEVAGIVRCLRAEGFYSICIETAPDGSVSIRVDEPKGKANMTELEKWKAERGSA